MTWYLEERIKKETGLTVSIGVSFNKVFASLAQFGYVVRYCVMNACEYGNVPQNRERIFCLGFKTKTEFRFPAPIDLEYRMYDFLEDYVDTENTIRNAVEFSNKLKAAPVFCTKIKSTSGFS
mgnify:CR=1 FL=1